MGDFNPGKKLKIKAYLYYVLAALISVLSIALAVKYHKEINSFAFYGHHGSVAYFLLAMTAVAVMVARKGRVLLRQSFFSNYGVEAEKSAVDGAMLLDWGNWKCWKDEGAYTGVGNIDMLITDPEGNPYNIEIKSWHKVKVFPDELRYANGKKMKKDPIKQALKQKEFIEKATGRVCTPILWLPKSSQGIDQYVGGVLVVSGSPRRLKRVIMKRFSKAQ